MAKNCFVKKEPAGYVWLKNTTGAKVSAGEFCILGDLGAIAQEEIAIHAEEQVTLHVSEQFIMHSLSGGQIVSSKGNVIMQGTEVIVD